MEEKLNKATIKMFELVIASAQDLEKQIGVLTVRMDGLYKVVQEVGETRIKDCNYSRDGYCHHIFYAMPRRPDDKKKDTVKIDDKYYPGVDWLMCYLCSKYALVQEQAASDQ